MKTWQLTLVMALAAGTASAQSPQSAAPTQASPTQALDFGLTTAPFDAQTTTFNATTPVVDKAPIVYQWHSSDLGYKRLLFEEPRLERQGISRFPPVQLAQSSAAFFSRSLLLPANFLLGRHRQPDPGPILQNQRP